MSGYRFCRSDDVALLVRAHNACWLPHFPGSPDLTVEGFKRRIRELQIWTSSCMVAYSGQTLIGVLLAAKREQANWIWRVAIHPDHCGQGHGAHLMTSLSQKLAILGPRRMLVDLPRSLDPLESFLTRCGYRASHGLQDWVAPAHKAEAAPEDALCTATGFDELMANGAFPEPEGVGAWERWPESLGRLRGELGGLAVVSPDRVEAFALYRDRADRHERRLMALQARDGIRGRRLLGLLVGRCRGTTDLPLVFPGVAEAELPAAWLAGWGFEPRDGARRFASEATPG